MKRKNSLRREELARAVARNIFVAKNPIPLTHMFDTHLRLPLCRLAKLNHYSEQIARGYNVTELGLDLRKYQF